ncbi:Crp/Fnr family transcriptional regulator [Aestuariicoccus sp. KMU-90]|uniref:Crp/Fnr family transcriptional regulator n=1 Tax=Thetidibacter halocola TaxID=2827239 RepID=A0A8J7WBB4_9RHOB|nr:Crp/Fnr family transcriptional regulator [Thetidibacter halocola]
MPDWTADRSLPPLADASRTALRGLIPQTVPQGTALFHPGEAAMGFVVVLSGRIEVFLTGPTGRDILLYAVEPGQSCVQSTLSLLGSEDYSGEAITRTECRLVLIPREMFLRLMDGDAAFRAFVFRAFAARMQSMMHLLERVAFTRVEARLAQCLLERADAGRVEATHAELAVMIGSAREVISRRLDALARRGLVRLERGAVLLCDETTLRSLAESDAAM